MFNAAVAQPPYGAGGAIYLSAGEIGNIESDIISDNFAQGYYAYGGA